MSLTNPLACRGRCLPRYSPLTRAEVRRLAGRHKAVTGIPNHGDTYINRGARPAGAGGATQ